MTDHLKINELAMTKKALVLINIITTIPMLLCIQNAMWHCNVQALHKHSTHNSGSSSSSGRYHSQVSVTVDRHILHPGAAITIWQPPSGGQSSKRFIHHFKALHLNSSTHLYPALLTISPPSSACIDLATFPNSSTCVDLRWCKHVGGRFGPLISQWPCTWDYMKVVAAAVKAQCM